MTDYLSFFNLAEDPFRLTPDSHFFYPSSEHNEVLSSLDYAIDKKEGFSLIVGEPGTGKTTLLRIFMDRWKEKAEIALVMTPGLSPKEFLQAVLEDLRVPVGPENKNEMIKAFRDTLIERSIEGKRVMIVVDEAQNLPVETLEELRLLSNLETEKEKLLQIVLIGQPELKKRIESDSLRQLGQRIAVKATLRPLSPSETRDYIQYRLVKAGRVGALFDTGATRLIYRSSKGVPRLVNLLSSRALMAAYIEGTRTVGKSHVKHAIRHLSYDGGPRKLKIKFVVYASAALMAAVLAALVIGVIDSGPSVSGKKTVAAQRPPAAQPSAQPGIAGAVQTNKEPKITLLMHANLRETPSRTANKVSWAARGTVFPIMGEGISDTGTKWYRVRMPDGGEAWISGNVVEKE